MKNTVAKIGEKLTSPSLIIFFNNIDDLVQVKFINIQSIYIEKTFLTFAEISI